MCSTRRDVWHLPGEGRDLAVRRLFSVLRQDFGHLIFMGNRLCSTCDCSKTEKALELDLKDVRVT